MMAYRHPHPEEDYPLGVGTPCHECAGTIVESKSADWPVGRRVIYLPALNLNGGAEYVVAQPETLVSLPDEGDLGDWLMCQPFGTVLYALSQAGQVADMNVAVLGQGCIGLLFTMVLKELGAGKIIAMDPNEHRLAMSRKLGANLAINTSRVAPVKVVQEVFGNLGADVVVDATGDAKALDTAGAFAVGLDLVAPAVAAEISKTISIATIGIGAGTECDGQILVTTDLWATSPDYIPRHVQPNMQVPIEMRRAITDWKNLINTTEAQRTQSE
jgi:NADPH:quinone reductase-like Zn-dependent oxidoreductase